MCLVGEVFLRTAQVFVCIICLSDMCVAYVWWGRCLRTAQMFVCLICLFVCLICLPDMCVAVVSGGGGV